MAAECFLCATGEHKIASPVGPAGEPLGVCKICSVMACGHHAQRDSSIPHYVCSLCDVTLLTVSATSLASNGSLQSQVRVRFGRIIWFPDEVYFFSLEDFIDRRPGYGYEFLHSIADYTISIRNNTFREYFGGITEGEAVRLLVAAGRLLQFLYKGEYPNDLPKALVFLAKNVRPINEQNF